MESFFKCKNCSSHHRNSKPTCLVCVLFNLSDISLTGDQCFECKDTRRCESFTWMFLYANACSPSMFMLLSAPFFTDRKFSRIVWNDAIWEIRGDPEEGVSGSDGHSRKVGRRRKVALFAYRWQKHISEEEGRSECKKEFNLIASMSKCGEQGLARRSRPSTSRKINDNSTIFFC